ncbi:Kynurenine formamidase [Maribacter sedimenticola]|uniref:Kynurenine formamidase n=1 Tax=Maribacter sedimenticola TaxID=228956 RepID=A0ABY1SDV8_9FLAO|nr:cyclase family protein [Maribacter sedimenticola]SNR28059.1 Kynurenine formamidase [Maribacter sedimenticola]
MKAIIHHNHKEYQIDLSEPLDISIAISGNDKNVNAWYVGPPKIAPHVDGNFVGAIASGSSTNFFDINFNPHAHGTHTECIGHISKEHQSINQQVHQFFHFAELITITPQEKNGDLVITRQQVVESMNANRPQALIIRTLPNSSDKLYRKYSHTNPPYILEDAMEYIRDSGVEHLLIDLPSVDKEKDDGNLLAHKAFWNYNGKTRLRATITEFVYVEDAIKDGPYFLNLQIAPFENDASPSRPVMYKIL